MKRLTPPSVLLLVLTTGCAVATVDPEGQTEDTADLGDGDGDTTSSGGQVVILGSGSATGAGGALSTGGTGAGGTLNTGGLLNTGGGMSAGGTGSGGMAAAGGGDPGGCLSLDSGDKESGAFGTTDAFCIIVDFSSAMNGWRANGAAGRTITINGEQVANGDINPGPLPMPGSSPYLIEFSAGDHEYCDFAFW
jgi:hypothetical protein